MSRLTLKELELLNTASAYNGEQHKAICGKAALELIEYKRIEEELDIDLIVLVKALKNGVWIKYKRHFFDKEYTIEHYSPEDFVVCFQKDLSDNCEAMLFKVRYYGDFYDGDVGREIEGDFGDTIYLSENYGKTWALTKEELLNGNN